MRPRSAHSLFRAGVLAAAVVLVAALAPLAAQAADDGPERRNSIRIEKDAQFDADHGVRSGSGTASDPYVISGWDVDFLEIHDTAAHVAIIGNTVRHELTLNWIGPGVHVMNNKVGDLRVNENVRRTGEPTSGHFSDNMFGFVGQIRHFDGTFEHNVVKPGDEFFDWDAIPFIQNGPAVNFDGFNGARFTNNTIYGPLRAQLHGHHHSSGYDDHSHHHSSSMSEAMDHSQRYHEVWITDNVIHSDESYALSYTDVAHSANDRTANSENEPELNKPHVHHTRVHLNNNKLVGSGLLVDVFNANDQRHTGTSKGLVEIKGNQISVARVEDTDAFDYKYAGIEVEQAKDLKLQIVGNEVIGEAYEESITSPGWLNGNSPSGIRLWEVEKGTVYLLDNLVTNHQYGIEASQFKDTTWYVSGLKTRGVEQDVLYDESAGAPRERQ
jgi:hypothetical protein